MRSSNLAIVFVDIAGFSERTGRQSRAQSEEWLKRFEELMLPLIRAFSGRKVKSIGDAYLLTFVSPTNALLFGMAAQDRLFAYNREAAAEQRIEIRVAVNVGEVREQRRDVFGEPVNIAARLEGITPRGEIWFTEAAYLAMTKSEVPTREVGIKQLKGIQDPVRVYRVPRGSEYRLEAGGDPQEDSPGYPFNGLGLERAEERGWVMSLTGVQGRVKQASARAAGGLAEVTGRGLTGLGRTLGSVPLKIWAVAGGILVAAGLLILLWPSGPFDEVEAALDDDLPRRALVLLERHPHKKEPRGRLLEARALLRINHPKVGRARNLLLGQIKRDPGLLKDERVQDDLVLCLNRRNPNRIMKLIEKRLGAAARSRLVRASRSRHYWLRWNGIRLLEKLGFAGDVDLVRAYILDLRYSDSCSTRKTAARKLGDLGDQRALKALREAQKKGFFDNLCMGDALEEAIRQIEK